MNYFVGILTCIHSVSKSMYLDILGFLRFLYIILLAVYDVHKLYCGGMLQIFQISSNDFIRLCYLYSLEI